VAGEDPSGGATRHATDSGLGMITIDLFDHGQVQTLTVHYVPSYQTESKLARLFRELLWRR